MRNFSNLKDRDIPLDRTNILHYFLFQYLAQIYIVNYIFPINGTTGQKTSIRKQNDKERYRKVYRKCVLIIDT